MKITEAGIDSGGILLKRIEWDDGQWWIFRSEVNWGTSRAIRKALTEIMESGEHNVDDAQVAQELRVVGSTEEWSFKLSITGASVDRIADWRIRHVLSEMLERQRIEVSSEETKKGFAWRFFSRIRFRRSTSKPSLTTT